jgi:flagellar hook assembly protein FlgD
VPVDFEKEVKERNKYGGAELYKNAKDPVGKAHYTYYAPTHITREKVPLDKLVHQEDTEYGGHIIDKYAKAKRVPPIEVSKAGSRYHIIDGHNRAEAAAQKGQTHIDAVVSHRKKTHDMTIHGEGKPHKGPQE